MVYEGRGRQEGAAEAADSRQKDYLNTVIIRIAGLRREKAD